MDDYLILRVPRSRYLATLASFGSAAANKFVLFNTPSVTTNFTLQGNNGAWVTIATDQYELAALDGYVVKRAMDDSGSLVDWSAYEPANGGGGYRATYTVDNAGTRTTYTNESQTFADDSTGFSPIGPEGQVNVAFAKQLVATYLMAVGGNVVVNDKGIFTQASGTPIFAVIGANTTWNGESFVAGDLLIGDNTADNIKYSASGSFLVRGVTTTYLTINSTGIQMAANSGINSAFIGVSGLSGTVDLDALGSGAGSVITGNCIRCASTGTWTLRSIVSGRDGQWLFVENTTANNMTIKNAGAAPGGFSAIRTWTGADEVTAGIGAALFVFNSNNNTWDLISVRA